MLIDQLCQEYITHWEQENIRKDFSLRFPSAGDFLTYLYLYKRNPQVRGLLKSSDGCKRLEEGLHKNLSMYISQNRKKIA